MILKLPHRNKYKGMRLFVRLPDGSEYTIDSAKVVEEVEVPSECEVVGRYLKGTNDVDILVRPEVLYSNMVNAGAETPAATEPEPNAGQADEVTDDVGETGPGESDEGEAGEAGKAAVQDSL